MTIRQRVVHAFERLVLAHVVADALAILWAVAAIPLAIHLFIRDIDGLNEDMNAIGQLVVRRAAWPAGTAFTFTHLAALPWAFGKDEVGGRAVFIRTAIALAALGVLAGGGSWIWLLVR